MPGQVRVETQPGPRVAPAKAIPAGRDRLQSAGLVAGVGGLLLAATGLSLVRAAGAGWTTGASLAVVTSAAFALLVWALRSATAPAAAFGGLVCLRVLDPASPVPWYRTPMPALLLLFLLTFAATRFGRRQKQRMGVAGSRRGRRASQVLANLGCAGLCAGFGHPVMAVACLAALAEATADTVSSELGQVLGGTPRSVLSWAPVAPGTDGAISAAGTAFGVLAALAIALASQWTGVLGTAGMWVVAGCGVAGLLFDSLLGATIEQRGWIGNDLVNLCSTAFAAAVAAALLALR